MVFFIMASNMSSTKENRNGKPHGGIGVEQIFEAKMFTQLGKGL
jgi:hypothetical protein